MPLYPKAPCTELIYTALKAKTDQLCAHRDHTCVIPHTAWSTAGWEDALTTGHWDASTENMNAAR